MPSSAILDVAIGIAFVYLFLSLICSVVNEGIAAVFSLRSKNLVDAIDSLFSGTKTADDKTLVEVLYAHGLIRGLYKDPAQADAKAAAMPAEKVEAGAIVPHVPVLEIVNSWFHVNLPSYIPSGTFATALIDVISPPDPTRARVLDDVREAIDKLPPSATQQALLSLVASTQKDLSQFQSKVEAWFNDSMDRASGRYKHRAQNILLVIGLAVTLLLNVDTIKMAQMLWTNPVARQATVDLAQNYVEANKDALQNKAPGQAKGHDQDESKLQGKDDASDKGRLQDKDDQASQNLATQADQLLNLGKKMPFPFGWQNWQDSWSQYQREQKSSRNRVETAVLFWGEAGLGWLITTLALSLGAPFWFDTLNKFMVVRSTVKPQEKSATEPSKDS